MLDTRTKEEKKEAAQECYKSLKAKKRTCAGCHLDYCCQMGKDNFDFMARFFKSINLE